MMPVPRLAPRLLPLLLALAVMGCSVFQPPPVVRGNRVDEEVLAQIVPGTSRRADVQSLLGTPSATSTFDDSEWYYIGGLMRDRVARVQSIEEQRVIAVVFNADGAVAEVRRLTEADAVPVQAVARVTPTPGTERTFLQQLFGNIGRLPPGVGGQVPGAGGPGPR